MNWSSPFCQAIPNKSNYLQESVFPPPAGVPLLTYGLFDCQSESTHLNWRVQYFFTFES